jgi:hypothetical protein
VTICRFAQIHMALVKICIIKDFGRTNLRPVLRWFCHERAKKGLNGSSFLFYGEKFADLPLADWHTLVICRFIIKICGFAICGRAILRNLRICNSGMIQRICGFAICGSTKKVSVPTFGRQSPQTCFLKPNFFSWAFH